MGIITVICHKPAEGKEGIFMDIMDFIRGNKNYFEDFITRSTYHSNAIEGNTLSYAGDLCNYFQ